MTYVIHTEDYRNHEITIFADEYVENPFTGWDCEPPIMVRNRDGITCYEIDEYPPELTREEIKENLPEILCAIDAESLLSLRHEICAYGVEDLVNCAISDCISKTDWLEICAMVYRCKGIAAEVFSVSGCVQSAWAEVLVVLTPEWYKKTGAPVEHEKENLEGAAQIYEDWAFGNVWCYSIEGANCDDSCGGFFGDYDGDYSALSEARSAIDHAIKARQEADKVFILAVN